MKSINKFFLPLAMITSIMLAFPGAAGQGEMNTASKTTLAPTGTGSVSKEMVLAKAASLAVPFVRNAGRFDKQVHFSADLFSGRFFLTRGELVYSLVKHTGKKRVQPEKFEWKEKPKTCASEKRIAFREYFVDDKGAKIFFTPQGVDKGVAKISYFRGNDPAKWQIGLASFNSVSLGDVYPGIQVKLKASGKNVEKIFYVNPGSDVVQIRIGVTGVAGLKIAEDGRLIFKNGLGELAMRAPVAWQEIEGRRRDVKVGYRLLGKRSYGFAITGGYDKNHPLVIDPELDTLVASTFLGGTDYAEARRSLALDGSGNVYLTGNTAADDFPTTVGAYDREINPEQSDPPYGDFYPDDIFISKLNGDLSELLASTYLGGTDDDSCYSMALDGSGNVFVAGSTNSADFPTTPGAYGRDHGFYNSNAFVSKLTGDLTGLLASTYLGGNGSDDGTSLALDGSGDVYLAGFTYSANFPTTPGVYDRTIGDNGNAFVSKLDNDLTVLLASTCLGGNKFEEVSALALDGEGNVYLTGTTSSTDFPTTVGAYDRIRGHSYADIFISKLDSRLKKLLSSTFLSGSGRNSSSSLILDRAGNIYLAGFTDSRDFPTTPGAYDRVFKKNDAFISKLQNDLGTLLASTFLGGNSVDGASSLALDGMGNVYLTGETSSADFPTTQGAYDRINQVGQGSDVFVSKLDGNLAELLGSTFLGGAYDDRGIALLLDDRGNIFLTGEGGTDFPTTPGAYARTAKGGDAAFVAKLKVTFPIGIDLLAERREVKAFSVVRQYGQIHFLADGASQQAAGIPGMLRKQGGADALRKNIAVPEARGKYFLAHGASVQVDQYRIMRRQGNGDFALLKAIAPAELQDKQFRMQDKYLEKGINYTYRVEAYDAAGQLIGISSEKVI